MNLLVGGHAAGSISIAFGPVFSVTDSSNSWMRTGVTAVELRDGIWTHPASTEALDEVLAARSLP